MDKLRKAMPYLAIVSAFLGVVMATVRLINCFSGLERRDTN